MDGVDSNFVSAPVQPMFVWTGAHLPRVLREPAVDIGSAPEVEPGPKFNLSCPGMQGEILSHLPSPNTTGSSPNQALTDSETHSLRLWVPYVHLSTSILSDYCFTELSYLIVIT